MRTERSEEEGGKAIIATSLRNSSCASSILLRIIEFLKILQHVNFYLDYYHSNNLIQNYSLLKI